MVKTATELPCTDQWSKKHLTLWNIWGQTWSCYSLGALPLSSLSLIFMINTSKHLHRLSEFQLKGTNFLWQSFWLLQKRRLLVQLSPPFTLPRAVNRFWGGGVSWCPSSRLPPQRVPSRHASCGGREPLHTSVDISKHRPLELPGCWRHAWGSVGPTCMTPQPFAALASGRLARLMGSLLDKPGWRHLPNWGFGHSCQGRESKVCMKMK